MYYAGGLWAYICWIAIVGLVEYHSYSSPIYIIPCSVELTIRWREDSTKLIKCCISLHQLNVEGDEDLEEQGTVSVIILVKTNFLWFLFNGFRYNCFCYATLVCSVLGKLVLTKEWVVDRHSISEVEYEGRFRRRQMTFSSKKAVHLRTWHLVERRWRWGGERIRIVGRINFLGLGHLDCLGH